MIYEVSIEPTKNSTINLDNIKVYLTEIEDEKEKDKSTNYNYVENNIKSLKEYDNRIIYRERILKNTKNYEKNFRLRTWISDDVDLSENDFGGLAQFTVNVKAKSDYTLANNSVPIPVVTGDTNYEWTTEKVVLRLDNTDPVIGGVDHYDYYYTEDVNDVPDDTTIPSSKTYRTVTINGKLKSYFYFRTVTKTGEVSPWSKAYTVFYDPNIYNITYVTNDGTLTEKAKTSYVVTDNKFDLELPTLNESEFLGWYDNAEFSGDKITNIDPKETRKNITLYAKWKREYIDTELKIATG